MANQSIIICGSFTDTLVFPNDTIIAPENGHTYMYVSKLTQDGLHEWTQTVKGCSPTWSVKVANEVYVIGTVRETTIIGNDTLVAEANAANPFVAKFADSGTCHWGRQIQVEKCSIYAADSFPGGICVVGALKSESIELGGKEYATKESSTQFLWVIDTAGHTQWLQLPGYEGKDDTPNFLDVIYSQATEEIYVAGNLWDGEIWRYRPCLLAYDLYGTFLWQKKVDSFARFLRLGLDSVGNIYFTGFFYSESFQIDGMAAHKNSLEDEPTIFVGKFNQDKHCEWLQTLRTTGSQWIWDLKVTGVDELYLAVN